MEKEIKDLLILLKNGKFIEILKKEKDLVKRFPNEPALFDILGITNVFLKKYEDAKMSFEKALKINPRFFQSLNNFGNLMYDLKEYNNALKYYKKALENKTKSTYHNQNFKYREVYNNIANVFNEIGSTEEAILNYEKAIEIDPDFYQAYNNLGNAQKRLGLLSDAISSYQACIRINPNYHLAHNNLGVAYYDIAKIEDSLSSYNKVLSIKPDYAPIYWNLHGCCSSIDDAEKLLQKCVYYDQNFLKAKYCLSFIQAYKGNFNNYNSMLNSTHENNPYIRSFQWIFSLPKLPELYFSRWLFFDKMIKISKKERPFYEFGVWTGLSFRYLFKYFDKGFGFDTFNGLPEKWYNEPKGFYSGLGKIPEIKGANFIKGEFNKTLPVFFKKKREKASIINLDADLYTSTLCALENSKEIIDEDTILIFDEFIINDQWENDEFRALNEFCENNKSKYEVLAFSLFTKQVAIKLKLKK